MEPGIVCRFVRYTPTIQVTQVDPDTMKPLKNIVSLSQQGDRDLIYLGFYHGLHVFWSPTKAGAIGVNEKMLCNIQPMFFSAGVGYVKVKDGMRQQTTPAKIQAKPVVHRKDFHDVTIKFDPQLGAIAIVD